MLSCSRCLAVKPAEMFYKDASKTRGYHCFCKACSADMVRARYRRNHATREQADQMLGVPAKPCRCEVPMPVTDEEDRYCLKCGRVVPALSVLGRKLQGKSTGARLTLSVTNQSGRQRANAPAHGHGGNASMTPQNPSGRTRSQPSTKARNVGDQGPEERV